MATFLTILGALAIIAVVGFVLLLSTVKWS
jgi:hypothetical protein